MTPRRAACAAKRETCGCSVVDYVLLKHPADLGEYGPASMAPKRSELLLVASVYWMLRRIFELPVLLFRRGEAKEIEILVLPHQVAVLRRQVADPSSDRSIACCLPHSPVLCLALAGPRFRAPADAARLAWLFGRSALDLSRSAEMPAGARSVARGGLAPEPSVGLGAPAASAWTGCSSSLDGTSRPPCTSRPTITADTGRTGRLACRRRRPGDAFTRWAGIRRRSSAMTFSAVSSGSTRSPRDRVLGTSGPNSQLLASSRHAPDISGRIYGVKIPTEEVRMQSTISEKGQITVPKPLRERLGIRAGDRLEFTEEHGHLVVRKATDLDPVAAAYGILSLDQSTDDTLRALRGEPDEV
jgi:antitoxin PrlF